MDPKANNTGMLTLNLTIAITVSFHAAQIRSKTETQNESTIGNLFFSHLRDS